jgi:hypothetical protein
MRPCSHERHGLRQALRGGRAGATAFLALCHPRLPRSIDVITLEDSFVTSDETCVLEFDLLARAEEILLGAVSPCSPTMAWLAGTRREQPPTPTMALHAD